MSCTPAPACKAAVAEANHIAPNRKDASDGICASPKHSQQNPTSDHEKGNAVDITHDPANGCDVDVLFDRIVRRRDKRVKYLIRSRRICRSYDKRHDDGRFVPAWTWDTYTGSNPHDKHGHISIHDWARNDMSPWFGAPAPTIPQPEPEREDAMPIIIRPVADNEPGADPNVGGEFLLVGDTLIAIGTPDEKQQYLNSGFKEHDMETKAWARLKHGCTVVE